MKFYDVQGCDLIKAIGILEKSPKKKIWMLKIKTIVIGYMLAAVLFIVTILLIIQKR
jgi:hypothetical protein